MKKRKKILSDHSGMTLVEDIDSVLYSDAGVKGCRFLYFRVFPRDRKEPELPQQAQKWNA